jgi:hypothetical protein
LRRTGALRRISRQNFAPPATPQTPAAPVDHNQLRQLIESSEAPSPGGTQRLMVSLVTYSWPGGSEDHACLGSPDRTENWPRRQAQIALERCTCDRGRCALCN